MVVPTRVFGHHSKDAAPSGFTATILYMYTAVPVNVYLMHGSETVWVQAPAAIRELTG